MNLFRKIQTSEFAKILLGCVVVGFSGFNRIVKRAKVNWSLIYSYLSKPLLIFFVPADASITRFVDNISFGISHILGMSANSQVFSSIIERIPVYMIYIHLVGSLRDDSVHQDCNPSQDTDVLVANGSPLGRTVPFPLIQVFKHIVVNQCKLTLREQNPLRHFILQNKMPPVPLARATRKANAILARKSPASPGDFYFSNYSTGVLYA